LHQQGQELTVLFVRGLYSTTHIIRRRHWRLQCRCDDITAHDAEITCFAIDFD